MLLRVIYRDGNAGMVKGSTIPELIKSGEIVAYKLGDRWVEVRRRHNYVYKGSERRVKMPY